MDTNKSKVLIQYAIDNFTEGIILDNSNLDDLSGYSNRITLTRDLDSQSFLVDSNSLAIFRTYMFNQITMRTIYKNGKWANIVSNKLTEARKVIYEDT